MSVEAQQLAEVVKVLVRQQTIRFKLNFKVLISKTLFLELGRLSATATVSLPQKLKIYMENRVASKFPQRLSGALTLNTNPALNKSTNGFKFKCPYIFLPFPFGNGTLCGTHSILYTIVQYPVSVSYDSLCTFCYYLHV